MTNTASIALQTLANHNLVEGSATWANDPDMLDMVASDSADFAHLALLMEEGRLEEAQSYLDRMDTSPRERAYDALEAAGALICEGETKS